jgi:uncharacterized iron-regulated membrane protein
MVLSGIVVWWPSIRQWALAFTIRWRGKGWYLRNYDLHKVVGILAVPVLFIVTVTGLSYEFYDPFTAGWYAVFPGEQPFPEDLTVPVTGAEQLPYADLAARAATAVPDATVTFIIPPEAEDTPAYVYLDAPFNPQWLDGFGNITVALNQYTGEVLYVYDLRKVPLSQQIYENWFWPLHVGNLAGWPTKVLYFLFGLSPLLLAVTGVITWVMRRLAAHRRAKARAAPAVRPQPQPAAGD